MPVNSGEVEIKLNKRDVVLRPTPRAARTINNLFGGYAEAHRRILAFDLNAYAGIVAAGLNKKPSEVEDDIIANGVLNLSGDLARFVTIIANGGKEPNLEDDGEEKSGEG